MPILVGRVKAKGGSGNTVTTDAASTQVSGSTFLACVADDGVASINTPTDSNSNVYSIIGAANLDGPDMAVYACINGVGSAAHTLTATTTGGSGLVSAILVEILSAKTSSSIDTGSNVATHDVSASPWDITSNSLAQALNMVCCFISGTGTGGNPCTFAESTGFLFGPETVFDGNSNFPLAFAYKKVDSTSAVSASFTLTAGALSAFALQIFAVQAASGEDARISGSILI